LIWRYAGDKSDDFNYYSKRGLLLGVYTSTRLFYLSDDSKEFIKTKEFIATSLESKITIEDNVVRFLVNNNNLKEDMRDGDVENIRTQYIKLLESLEPIILANSLQDIDVKAICEKIYKQQLTLLLSGSDATIGSVKQLTSLCKILDNTSLDEDDKKRRFLELQKSAHELIVAMRKDLRSDSLLHL
jgi:hypothetical protein